ncbi:MAG: DUF4920 domain-containing protein [Saprospiraceae bacterium]|nr:DUF4920 domain-containing protein [Saprospiraceae bacterium]
MIVYAHAQEDQYEAFGDEITLESAMVYDDLMIALEGKDSVQAKVAGQIDDVCQVKGCWMNVSGKTSENQSVFVKFKDYGFFVPKDAAGKDVVIEGVAYREITPVEELRHYAKDAGKSEEEIAEITDPKEEIRFVANGVLIKVN